MKRIAPIILLSVYLISITELNQLIKLPILVEHFIEHKEKSQNLSFWEFLSMHYTKNVVKDADYDKDMQLPFKSHDGCSTSFLIAFLTEQETALSTKPLIVVSHNYSADTNNSLSAAHLSSIWQPPKSC